MGNEMLDQLLLMWREEHDKLQEIEEQAKPIKQAMNDLMAQIKPLVIERGRSYTELPTVEATYKKGYFRTSFPNDAVLMTVAFLKDFAPNAAQQLEESKKITAVAPSVSVKAKEA